MNDYHEPVIFSNLPNLEELLLVVVTTNPLEIRDPSVKTDFQWQLLKTRLLIYSDKNVIACPIFNNNKYLNVICKKDYFNSGCFSILATKHLLKVEATLRPPLEIYKECLLYNVMCKMTPDWNKVEKYFIMDKYFLMKRGVLSAVQINLSLSDKELLLFCHPKQVWLTPLDILEFNIPMTFIEHMASRKFYIDLTSNPFWVHVLPSFKRGRAVYVTNRLPDTSLYKDYNQIRRHWKNIHGFRLPEEDSQMIYVGVNFFGTEVYTYPIICVRKGVHENEGDPSLKEYFVKYFDARASDLLGGKLILQNSSSKNLSHYQPVPFKKWSEKSLLEIDSRLITNFVSPQSLKSDLSCKMAESSNTTIGNEDLLNAEEKPITPADRAWFEKCSTFIDGLSQLNPKRSYVSNANKPVFMKNPRNFCESAIRKAVFIEDPRQAKSHHENSSITTERPVVTSKSETNALPYKPIFTAKKLPFQRNILPKIEESCNDLNVKPVGNEVRQLVRPIFNKKSISNMKPKETKVPDLLLDQNMNPVSFTPNRDESSEVTTPVQRQVNDSKTTQEKSTEASEKKKPPQFSTDEEIVHHFRSGTLSKVKVPSLYKFLRRHGVPCHSKDKKNELLVKAVNLLTLKVV